MLIIHRDEVNIEPMLVDMPVWLVHKLNLQGLIFLQASAIPQLL